MTNEIFISVVICNYNYDKHIGEAIESVLSQEYRRYELIIVDDGSTDNSREIIRKYETRYPRQIAVIYQENKGQAAGFNTAFKASKGDVLCFLDSDDMWLPGKLKFVNKWFGRFDNIAVLQHNLKVIRNGIKTSGNFRDILICGEYFRETQKTKRLPQFVPTSGLSFSRRILEKVFPIPEDFKTCADGYMTRTAFCHGKVYSAFECQGFYRSHSCNNIFGNKKLDLHDYVSNLLVPHLNAYYRKNDIDLRLPQLRPKPPVSQYGNLRYLVNNRHNMMSKIFEVLRRSLRTAGVMIDKGDRILSTMKGIYRGEKCFVLGRNVNYGRIDIGELKNEFVILSDVNASEDRVRELNKGIYCISDVRVWLNGNGVSPNLVSFLRRTPKLSKLFEGPAKGLLKGHPDLAGQQIFFKNVNHKLPLWKGYFEEDITRNLCWGYHVVLDMCLPLAFYLGFSEVHVLGCSWKHEIESQHLKRFFSLYAYGDHYNLTENILPYESIYGPIEELWECAYEHVRQMFVNHNKKVMSH